MGAKTSTATTRTNTATVTLTTTATITTAKDGATTTIKVTTTAASTTTTDTSTRFVLSHVQGKLILSVPYSTFFAGDAPRASFRGGCTAWPSVPSRQWGGQMHIGRPLWFASKRFTYSRDHGFISSCLAAHFPLATSSLVMIVKGSGCFPSAPTQKAPLWMCIAWWVSSVTTTRSIFSLCVLSSSAILLESSVAPPM